MEQEGMLDGPSGARLAYALLEGRGARRWDPCLVFLPGFASDMRGTKALSLRDFCAERGHAMLRLDYSGHGASGGRFEDGTIGAWMADAEAVIREAVPERRLLLVGSSMGGWIALLLALRLGARVAGLVGIAAAPDFTEELIRAGLTDQQRERLARDGVLMEPNPYGPPTPITARLLEDGARYLLLRGPIPLSCPIRLLHGQRDEDVPWRTSLRIAELAESEDVRVTLVKDGDHRLSRPQDLALLLETIRDVSDDCSSGGEADAG